MTPHHIPTESARHQRWVKISHWIITVSFLLLGFTGFVILMAHPRLYWGEVGNDLTPALFELPISRNYQHGGWEDRTAFFNERDSPISANRTYDIFNKNGWGRSLHFLSAWVFVVTGLIYLLAGIFTGHFRNRIWPKRNELTVRLFWRELINHLRMQIPFGVNARYNLLQKYAYMVVIFVLLPLIVLTGMTMSPAIAAAYPFLLKVFGGSQSARTIHFFSSVVVELFLIVHVVMVIKSGFRQQMQAMTFGK
ncbi:MAG TPA: cytochrome b/b6 domain-containing protein [Cyclobacteriaceae bacterium]|nr:cytochrome b/b6 domain-containing protein [Cyclobacteriaceae bacterium]